MPAAERADLGRSVRLVRTEWLLDEEFDGGKAYKADKADWLDGKWSNIGLPAVEERGETGVGLGGFELDLGRDVHALLGLVFDRDDLAAAAADADGGYAADDPKHPDWHDVHADDDRGAR